MNLSNAKWICSGKDNPKDCSLAPETYFKKFVLENTDASLSITALGIYVAYVNGKRIGNDYFTPGYTNYKKHIQVQTYDISKLVHKGENIIEVTVANGWYLGRIGNKHNIYGAKRALLAKISTKIEEIVTDESWLVSFDYETSFADFYDGETINHILKERKYEQSKLFIDKTPKLINQIGAFVREHEVFVPTYLGDGVYDFKQNFAGITRLKVKASEGTVITVQHFEVLMNNKPFYKNYRSAKVTDTYICKEGEQEFKPNFTYRGFRYVEIKSDKPIKILSIEGIALYSDMERRGTFVCSNEKINKLQNCIEWSAKSNFIEIPTDCPQRDERLGWTGDLTAFISTSDYLFDTQKFIKKWLFDMFSEQASDGAIPNAVPYTGMFQPKNHPIPLLLWGDSALIIPFEQYLSYGDKKILEDSYEGMKKYIESIRRISEKKKGDKKYLWSNNPYQFGDWCAYGKSWVAWNKRGNQLSSLWYYNGVNILVKTSKILGKAEDEKNYQNLVDNIQRAFIKTYLKDNGRLKGHYMSMYVNALAFDIIPSEYKDKVSKQLVDLVVKNDYKVMTGFPGTLYLLHVLAENGYEDVAYKVLLNEHCPGWLHMVKHDATTIWERWDAIEEDGKFFHGGAGMVSFNHYAYGSVGSFLYQKILGLNALEPGYKTFMIKPLIGDLEFAKGSLLTEYGEIKVSWERKEKFILDVTVPKGTKAIIILPNGEKEEVYENYHREVNL